MRLRERHVRILWASWHGVSIFGCGCAALLFHLAQQPSPSALHSFALDAMAAAMLASSALVGYAIRGIHPGWIGLLAIAIMIGLA